MLCVRIHMYVCSDGGAATVFGQAALAAHGWRKLNQRLDRIEDKLDH